MRETAIALAIIVSPIFVALLLATRGGVAPIGFEHVTVRDFVADEWAREASGRERYAAAHREIAAEMIATAKADVVARLRDPASVVFGHVARGKGLAVCGHVNTRNGFGGMTGMQPFIAGFRGGQVVFADPGVMPQLFEAEWRKYCR